MTNKLPGLLCAVCDGRIAAVLTMTAALLVLALLQEAAVGRLVTLPGSGGALGVTAVTGGGRGAGERANKKIRLSSKIPITSIEIVGSFLPAVTVSVVSTVSTITI